MQTVWSHTQEQSAGLVPFNYQLSIHGRLGFILHLSFLAHRYAPRPILTPGSRQSHACGSMLPGSSFACMAQLEYTSINPLITSMHAQIKQRCKVLQTEAPMTCSGCFAEIPNMCYQVGVRLQAADSKFTQGCHSFSKAVGMLLKSFFRAVSTAWVQQHLRSQGCVNVGMK